MLTEPAEPQRSTGRDIHSEIQPPASEAASAPTNFEDVVDAIYRSMADPMGWTGCLALLAQWFESDGAYLAFWDTGARRLTISHLNHPASSAERQQLRRYEANAGTDPRLDGILRCTGRAMTSDMLMPEAEFRKTSVYRKHLCDARIEHSMAVAVPAPQGAAVFCLTRRGAVSAFNNDDCEDLEQFVPHLKRAVVLGHKVAACSIERQIGWDLLNRSSNGLLVTDAHGRVLRRNKAADSICRNSDEVHFHGGHFRLSRRADQERLQDRLAAVSDGARAAMAVARATSDRPLTITILPIGPIPVELEAPAGVAPYAVLVLSDPSAPPARRADMMHALFGLTRTEGRLVDALLAEPGLGEAAAMLGMTKNTARQHLKSIFQKTRSNSQSQLLRLALSVPESGIPQDSEG